MNVNKLEEKVIQYLTDELGYPKESIKIFKTESYIDLDIFVFGKSKIYVRLVNTLPNNLSKLKEDIRIGSIVRDASYYVITNGISYHCFEVSLDKRLNEIPSYEKMKNIQPIHEEIFRFLENEQKIDKGLTYKLRTTNNNSRLEKGYWFLGNNDYLVVSFWEGTDWKNKTPNIYITCEPSGKFSLVFTSRDSSVKANFLQNLASILPGFKQGKSKGEPIAYWEKILAQPSDAKSFLDILAEFIKTDKKIIDTFISNELEVKKKGLDGIDFILQKKFEQNLQRILKYRKELFPFIRRPESANQGNTTTNNHSLFLKKLQLNNIGQFRTITLNLDFRVICLLGENGIGKSTILRALILGLIGVEETSEIDIERQELQQLLRIVGERNGMPVFVSSGQIILDYELSKPFTNQINFEKIESETDIRISDSFKNSTNSFGATLSGNYLTNLVIGFSQVQSRENGNASNSLDSIKKTSCKRCIISFI